MDEPTSATEFHLDELLPQVYHELRQLAQARMAAECDTQTLQPTGLVHEVYLRFLRSGRVRWADRRDLLIAAAEAMRRILIDRARSRKRQKRGGGWARVSLEEAVQSAAAPDLLHMELAEALGEFEQRAPEAAQVVKLRYFGGLSLEEIAELLGLSRSTAYRRWKFGLAWLLHYLDHVERP